MPVRIFSGRVHRAIHARRRRITCICASRIHIVIYVYALARDHGPVDAANRASRAIAWGAAALRPKASSVPHVATSVAIRSSGLRESLRAPRKPSVFAAPTDTNAAFAAHGHAREAGVTKGKPRHDQSCRKWSSREPSRIFVKPPEEAFPCRLEEPRPCHVALPTADRPRCQNDARRRSKTCKPLRPSGIANGATRRSARQREFVVAR